MTLDDAIVSLGYGKINNMVLFGKDGKIVISRATYSLAVSTEEMKPRVLEIINAAKNGLFFTSGSSSSSTAMTAERKKAILDRLVANMVRVEGGTFTMGATPEQAGVFADNEKPIHQVTLSDYYIGRYEVTQEEWDAVMGSNNSHMKGDRRPVEMVSWNACQTFIRKLNAATGKRFRLPTEAEWEYAARGGKLSNGYRYSGSNDLNQVAWNVENSRNVGEDSADYGTHVVGTLAPNELGIYDMSGNVSEWCQDWEGNYRGGMQTNPRGPASGQYRIERGGSWYHGTTQCRVSCRGSFGPGGTDWALGLRLAL
ncbi:MAG: formylglycine-generating enzyme family protein [Bacteroidaceae bacterium]|nr:formylglycine-generating enzyme family protein [Bacteroidaceae bacterium]